MNTKEMLFVGDYGYSYLDVLFKGNIVIVRQSRIGDKDAHFIGDMTHHELALKLANEDWQDAEEVEWEELRS